MTGRVGSSGAGGAIVEVVCVMTAGEAVVILAVGDSCGGAENWVVTVVFTVKVEAAEVS